MSIHIETPVGRLTERTYILRVLLGEWIGLNWRLTQSSRSDVRITLDGHVGELHLPDILFSLPETYWLTDASLPRRPLPLWDTRDLADDIALVDQEVPVIYGCQEGVIREGGQVITLPIDTFGSAFFMLSRYEELVTQDRDEHDRFPAWASVAYHENFLERPIIDEYVELLWTAMKSIWPGLHRKQRDFAIKVSHDVDAPSRYGFKNPARLIRAIGADVVKRRNFSNIFRAAWINLNTRNDLHISDPVNTFDWLMDVSEQHGLTSAFYFICGRTDPIRDAEYDLEHPAIRSLMRRIHKRGHEIGLHPSYNTYRNPEKITFEANRLKRVCADEGLEQSEWGGRMHFLRWENPTTLYGWEKAGMAYDSTLSFADRPGFRCGTCFEYPAFDPVAGKQLGITIRPLIAMECSVTADRYLGLGISLRALEKFVQLRNSCRAVNGTFTLLWHNTELTTVAERRLYRSILSA